jgi:hypothetical protein
VRARNEVGDIKLKLKKEEEEKRRRELAFLHKGICTEAKVADGCLSKTMEINDLPDKREW